MDFRLLKNAVVEKNNVSDLEFSNTEEYLNALDAEYTLTKNNIKKFYGKDYEIIMGEDRVKKIIKQFNKKIDLKNKLENKQNLSDDEQVTLNQLYEYYGDKATFTPLTKKEKEERVAIHNRAVDVIANYCATLGVNNAIMQKFIKTYNYPNTRFVRSAFLSLADTPRGLVEALNKFHNASKAEKTVIMDNMIKDAVEKLKNIGSMRDEELVEFVNEHPSFFDILPEMDGEKIANMYKDLGLEYKSSIRELVSKVADPAVSIGSKPDRVAAMASPAYLLYREEDSYAVDKALTHAEQFDGKFFDELFYDNSNMNSKVQKFLTGNGSLDYKISADIDYKTSCQICKNEANLIDTVKLEMIRTEGKFVNEKGKELTVEEAVDHFKNKKGPLIIMDNNGNVVNRYTCDIDKSTFIVRDDKVKNVDLTNVNDVKAKLTQLIDTTTHWYMGSSPEYKALRIAIKNLDKESNYTLDEKLEKIYNLSQDYLKYKYSTKNTKGKSERTMVREEAAAKISNLLEDYKPLIVVEQAKDEAVVANAPANNAKNEAVAENVPVNNVVAENVANNEVEAPNRTRIEIPNKEVKDTTEVDKLLTGDELNKSIDEILPEEL